MAAVLEKPTSTTDSSEIKGKVESKHLSASKVKISDLSDNAKSFFNSEDRDGLKFLPDDHLNTLRNGHTPAMFAAQYNRMDIVLELLQLQCKDLEIHHIVPKLNGDKYNTGIGHGQNLLGICINYCGGNRDDFFYIINALIEKDKKAACEFTVQDDPHKGLNYFQCAAMSGNVPVIKLLQALGFDIYAKTPDDQGGHNVVHLAVINGNVDALDYFKSLGININEKDANGWSPLQIAQNIVRYRALGFEEGEYVTPDFPASVKEGLLRLLSEKPSAEASAASSSKPAFGLTAFESDKEKSTGSSNKGKAADDSEKTSSSALSSRKLSSPQ